jgi:8-amino-7-oxononanoate synthase
VIDFTSALYLGLDHASRSLPGWDRLTLGKPAALEAPPGAVTAEKRLATLIGCERALLATSTLHLFLDLFTVLAQRNVNIFLDSGSYPVARWGVERAAYWGTRVTSFRQHDPRDLQEALRRGDGKLPLIVADGYCPGCGRRAPIAEYLAQAEARGGFLVVDDSQALGIFGTPAPWAPYGMGGGGSMQRAGLTSDRLIVGASLAKAFGAPVAVLAGSATLVDEFARQSSTRVHCSPPSSAVIAAANRALAINRKCGDALRMGLAQRVSRFREGLRKLGLIAIPSLFPVQPLRLPGNVAARKLHEQLQKRGVESVLHRADKDSGISFVISVRHSLSEIDCTLAHLAGALAAATRMKFERS